MSFSEYPASVPWRFYGNGDVIFGNTGAIQFQSKTVNDFVLSATGGLITSADGVALSQLAPGTVGQMLTVGANNVLTWTTLASQGPVCSVFATGDSGAIAASTTWHDVVKADFFSSSATGGVSTAQFDEDSGTFTAPADGVYEVSAIVAFTPNNSGGGVTLTNPSGRASRQMRIVNFAETVVYATAREQAPPSANNPTVVSITSMKLNLLLNDTVKLQVRHDAQTSLSLLGANRESWFSISRVR